MASPKLDGRLNFAMMSDEEIVACAREGNPGAVEYLLAKYRHMVEGKARTYYLTGADRDDVVQEGMIGLFKAIRDYRTDRLSQFRGFAELCVTRQIITAVKTATRQKHGPLNEYISLHHPVLDWEGEGTLIECIADERVEDPAASMLHRRNAVVLREQVADALSDLEVRVLQRYLEGKTYREISRELHCRTKCIDNALQRAKRKVGLLLLQDGVVAGTRMELPMRRDHAVAASRRRSVRRAAPPPS
ncbi:MAG: RNA polymerase sporulation sigma factor SigH [Chthonomonadales bacterium]